MEIKINVNDFGWLFAAMWDYNKQDRNDARFNDLSIKLIELRKAFDRGETEHTLIVEE